MLRFMAIGIEKLEGARTLEQVDKIEKKTCCQICCCSGYNSDGGCAQCPVEGKLIETRERLRNRRNFNK